MVPAPPAEPQADLVIAVVDCTLGPDLVQRAERERLTLSVSVDLLGRGTGGLRTPQRLARAGEALVSFGWQHRIVVEPGEPIWEPLVEALKSEDEQDSDCYFILSGRGGVDGEKELGTAHLNLEEMLRLGHDETRARLPVVDDTQRRVAWLTVSVRYGYR